MTKIEELLNVLDLPEVEQCKYLSDYFTNRYYKTDEWPRWYGVCDILIKDTFPSRKVVLADLAFRLRDEVAEQPILFKQAREIVVTRKMEAMRPYADVWFIETANPIRWIIAALIAKELSKASKE